MFFSEKRFSKEEKIDRKVQAEAIFGNPIFAEAFETLEADYTKAWKQAGSTAEREGFWLALKNLASVKQHLEIIIEDGVVTAKEIERLNRR